MASRHCGGRHCGMRGIAATQAYLPYFSRAARSASTNEITVNPINPDHIYRIASIPFFSARVRSLREGPLGRIFSALPFADENRAHVQRQSKGRLAHVRLLADAFDRFGFERLHRGQATQIEMPHRGFVDHADVMKVLRDLMERPERIAPVALRPGHISNSLHPLVAATPSASSQAQFAHGQSIMLVIPLNPRGRATHASAASPDAYNAIECVVRTIGAIRIRYDLAPKPSKKRHASTQSFA